MAKGRSWVCGSVAEQVGRNPNFFTPIYEALYIIRGRPLDRDRDDDETDELEFARSLRRLASGKHSTRVRTAFAVGETLAERFPWCSGIVTLFALHRLDAYVALLSQLPACGFNREQIQAVVNDVYCATMPHEIDGTTVPAELRRLGRVSLGAALLANKVDLETCLKQDGAWVHDRMSVMALRDRTSARETFRLEPDVRARLAAFFSVWLKTPRREQLFETPSLQQLYANATTAVRSVEESEAAIDEYHLCRWLDSLTEPSGDDDAPRS